MSDDWLVDWITCGHCVLGVGQEDARVDGGEAVLERDAGVEQGHAGGVDGAGQLVAARAGRLHLLQRQLDGGARVQLRQNGTVADRLDRVLVDLFLRRPRVKVQIKEDYRRLTVRSSESGEFTFVYVVTLLVGWPTRGLYVMRMAARFDSSFMSLTSPGPYTEHRTLLPALREKLDEPSERLRQPSEHSRAPLGAATDSTAVGSGSGDMLLLLLLVLVLVLLLVLVEIGLGLGWVGMSWNESK